MVLIYLDSLDWTPATAPVQEDIKRVNFYIGASLGSYGCMVAVAGLDCDQATSIMFPSIAVPNLLPNFLVHHWNLIGLCPLRLLNQELVALLFGLFSPKNQTESWKFKYSWLICFILLRKQFSKSKHCSIQISQASQTTWV